MTLTPAAGDDRYSSTITARVFNMDEKDHGETSTENSGICRLEWIAWAIDAARRHKEDEQRQPEPARVSPRATQRGEAGRG